MLKRYKVQPSRLFPVANFYLFAALREKWKEGYGLGDLRADLMAGMVVALVAVPLGMALGIASGVPPQYGLYTVVIAGAAVALLGGSRFQVTGPTAAFVVILVPIVQKFGFSGLLLSGLMAGVILVLMGVSRLGRLIQFIPHPVTTGFTSGIAVVIATLQIKDFFGLQITEMPEGYFSKVAALFQARGTFSLVEFLFGALTLALLVLWPRMNKKLPAPLIALVAASVGAFVVKIIWPEIEIATIGSRFSFEIDGIIGQGIPQIAPQIDWPWNFTAHGEPSLEIDFKMIEMLVPGAFAIAMLGAIESLLSAVVADGMAQTRHNPDTELIALGVGNILCPFFGAIPATGAIARTATNIRFGARSPLSAVFHAIFALLIILLFAPLVSYLPMAALAALLILVAYNMSELAHFKRIVKVAPVSDVIVLLICFSLTVVFDMVVGVTAGVLLAALLFMRRMAEVSGGHALTGGELHVVGKNVLPDDVILYEIEGPLFFGAAEKAASALNEIRSDMKDIVLLMKEVPAMDVTGLVALESAIRSLSTGKRKIYLVGLKRQPRELIERSGVLERQKGLVIAESLEEVLKIIEAPQDASGQTHLKGF